MKKLIMLSSIGAMLLLLAFAPAAPKEELCAECANQPPVPNVTVDVSVTPFKATANYFNIPYPDVDGFEWTITNGYIVSGQGTSTIQYFRSSPATTIICVRAYVEEGGERCYSSESCASAN